MPKLPTNKTFPGTRHDLNLKILARSPRHRENDLIGHSGRYRDEERAIYLTKKEQFLETSKQFNKLNQETMLNSKRRLHQDYICDLEYKFLEKVYPPEESCAMDCSCRKMPNRAEYSKKRTTREITLEKESADVDVCSFKPWLTKYMKLRKFIHAAWTIIKKNRLLTVLEILRNLDRDEVETLSKLHRRCYNVTNGSLFEKFL